MEEELESKRKADFFAEKKVEEELEAKRRADFFRGKETELQRDSRQQDGPGVIASKARWRAPLHCGSRRYVQGRPRNG